MQEPILDAEPSVLLIEDSPADARLVQALVAEAGGMTVIWVPTFAAALHALAAHAFDAVLLDLSLPDARGADLIGAIRAAAPGVAIVVVSGQAEDDQMLARAVVRKGADDLLPKQSLTATLLARSLAAGVERARLKAAADRREAALAGALAAARIGHWSWEAGSRAVRLAGHFPGLTAAALAGSPGTASRSVRALLRLLPGWARQSLYAAWREPPIGVDRVGLVIVEAGMVAGDEGHDLVLDTVVHRDRDGRVRRLEGSVRDVADAVETERLEAAMITQLGHELRTPLTTIRGALGLLASAGEAGLTKGTRALLDNAIASADRIGRVIGDTLETDRPPPGALRFQPRRVPVGPFLYDALAARLPGLTAAGLTIRLTPRARALEQPLGAGQLRRAVDHLCGALLAASRRIAADAPAPRRFTLDVAAKGGVAWLEIVASPAKAHGQGGAARARLPSRPAAHRSLAAADRRMATACGGAVAQSADPAWRIAVALVA